MLGGYGGAQGGGGGGGGWGGGMKSMKGIKENCIIKNFQFFYHLPWTNLFAIHCFFLKMNYNFNICLTDKIIRATIIVNIQFIL